MAVIVGNSTTFGEMTASRRDWQVEFVPDREECATWDDVFDVRRRIARDLLTPSFTLWLTGFRTWYRLPGRDPESDRTIIQSLRHCADYGGELGYGDRAFLKAACFSLLYESCLSGDARLVDVLRDLLTV